MTSDSEIRLVAVADLIKEAQMHTDRLAELVQSRHPDVDVTRFGATAWPDGVTKGDIDVLLRVPAGEFGDVLATLLRCV